MLWIASHFGPNGASIKTIPLQQGPQFVNRRIHFGIVEGRAQIEPRGIGKLAGIRRCMNLALNIHGPDEPLAGGPEDQV